MEFDETYREIEPAMKIQSVRIKNFRTLKDVTIPFDSVTTFIGPNGAGKSTVLRALDWFFNGKPGSLTEKDCSFGATDEEVEVQVTFADLTEKDRDQLGKYAPAAVTTFTVWKRRSTDGTDCLQTRRAMRRLTKSVLRDQPPTRSLLITICGHRMHPLVSRRGAALMPQTKQ
jgi:predicted ATPase